MSTHVFNFHSLIASGIEPLLNSVGCLWSLTVPSRLPYPSFCQAIYLLNYIDLHVTFPICNNVFSPKVVNCPFWKVVL